jgi:DNA-directed RNA polymerase specialized sigma24 family protein
MVRQIGGTLYFGEPVEELQSGAAEGHCLPSEGGGMSPDSFGPTWVGQLQAGDSIAAQRLFDCYFEQLVRLAQRKLAGANRRVADEEDVALGAINSFCRGVQQGRFPQLDDPEDLWRVLVTITANKALQQIRDGQRQKRGGGNVRGESVFRKSPCASENFGIDQVVGEEPSPQFAAELAERFEALLDCLPDEGLRKVAILKMQGYTNDEIGEQLGWARRSVERKLKGIRTIWTHKGES